MVDDRGNLSIDFLAGMTIFMLALIWVSTMIPGLLIGLQSKTIDLDAIAYRTGVILVEDPGMPANPPWENKNDLQKNEIDRFGLAASKDSPNILSLSKVERFFCSTSFSYPTDYQKRLIFGDRQYGYNITFSTFDALITRSVGVIKPDGYGYIRRLVKIKYPSNTTIDAQKYKNSQNTTQHIFSIELNCTELIMDEQNFAYQINPRRDQIMVNITNLSGARVWHKLPTDNITLYSIDISRRDPNPPYGYSRVTSYGNDNLKFQAYIDGGSVTTNVPARVSNNITVLFSPGFFYGIADDFSIVRVSYTFIVSNPSGDNFFNNSFTTPYSYNYSPNQVTQPQLKDGVVEVAVWTAPFGAYSPALVTPTSTPLQLPLADFFAEPRVGPRPLSVLFTDISSGSPTTWDWTFGDIGTGNTSTAQNPSHTYTTTGTYSVKLTVTNAAGSNTMIKTDYITVGSMIPVADFTANTTSGLAPLAVQFTDTSTGTPPTMWNWTFGDIGTGNTSIAQNPSHTYTTAGTYSVNLTVSGPDGSNTLIKTNYITVNPSPSWYCGWSYRKNITIDKSKVPADQTNFPVLINLASDSDLAARARSDAYDIFFTSSDGTTKLSHEIESYTSSTGALVAWVKVPSVSSSANTTIYMYYGNSGAADQQDKNNVWDSNYKGVWHLDTVFTDSTSNGNTGTNSGTTDLSPGRLAKARNFLSSSSQYIDAGSGSSINIASTAITVEAWIKATTWRDNYWEGIIVSNSEWASSHAHGYDLRAGKSGGANGEISFNVGQGTNNVWIDALSTTAGMVTGTWYHVAGRYNGTYVEVFVNGVSLKTTANTLSMSSSPVNVNLGRSPYDVTRLFNGGIDEIRISNSARSSTWITTEYNNQNSPSTFYSVGSPEGWSCAPTTPTPTPTPTLTPTPTPTPSPPWYCGWSYRKNITIQHAQVSGSLTDFPVLINLASDADLAARAQSDGDDILFTASDGTTKLKHEIESYTSGSGALVAWVKVPSVTYTTDTTIIMYYGNAGAANQQEATNVWDGNFKGVWHLKENPFGTAPQMRDSTSNANHGTSAATMTSGDQVAAIINGGLDFDGSNDEITCGNAANLRLTGDITIEAWAKTSSTGTTRGIVNKAIYAGASANIKGYMLRKYSTNYYRFAIGDPGAAGQYIDSNSAYTDANWHHIVGVRRSGTGYLYIDGVQQTATMTRTITDSGANFDIGRSYSDYDAYWWNSYIDEVRVSDTGRTADWILTGYRNQNSPSTFYSVGSQQTWTC